jgi:hypothetical protein
VADPAVLGEAPAAAADPAVLGEAAAAPLAEARARA